MLVEYKNYLNWVTAYAFDSNVTDTYNKFYINYNKIKYMLEKYSESNPKIKKIKENLN